MRSQGCAASIFLAAVFPAAALAQAPFERIARAALEPRNWLTYSGNLQGTRHSSLSQINPRNAAGQFCSIWKAELARYEIVHTTPMPSFRDKLQPGEVEDLVAYLASLRGAEVQ